MKVQIIHKGCESIITSNDLKNGVCPSCNGKLDVHNIGCVVVTDTIYNNEREHYTTKFIEVAESIIEHARGDKTDDYGETWKRLGLMGLYIKIFIKEGRLNQLIWKKKGKEVSVKDETIRDTLKDIAAYAMYGMIAYDEGNINGDETSAEYINEMLVSLIKTLERLGKNENIINKS